MSTPNPVLAVAFGLPLLLTALTAAPGEPIDETALRELKATKKVKLQIRQDYEQNENPENEKGRPRSGSPADTKGFLPLLELTSEIIKASGWALATAREPADVTIKVEVLGTPLGASYTSVTSGPSGYHYTGARLAGTITVEKDNRVLREREFDANVPVQNPITRSYSSWSDAPFRELLPEYCSAVWLMLAPATGPAPLLAGLEHRGPEIREGALRALVTEGEARAASAFLRLVADPSEDVSRLAALGLGALGAPDAMPALLSTLRSLPAPPEADATARRAWLEIEGEREPAGDRAESVRLQLAESGNTDRRQAVFWALLQADAPDRGAVLRAALRDPASAEVRANAALLLGRAEGRAARESLLTALADPSPLVRAAVVVALGDGDDRGSIDLLLTATGDADELVRDLAREALGDARRKRWDEHVTASRIPHAHSARQNREFMVTAFGHEDPLVRAEALDGVSGERLPDLLPAIRGMARQDKLPFLRYAALDALTDQHDPESTEAVIAGLGDPVAFVRRHALDILSGSASEWEQSTPPPLPASVVGPVLALVKTDALDDPGTVLALLQRVEGPAGIAAIERLARESGPVPLRRQAFQLLAETRPAGSWPLLLEVAAQAEGELAYVLRDCLMKIQEPAMVDPLITLLKSNSRESRRLAANVLGQLKQPRAIGPLVAALQAAEAPGPGRDEVLADGARLSLQTLTGRSFPTSAEWRQWWKNNAARLTVP